MRADRSLLAGLFLVCLANMLLEIIVTRLFSAMMFYHFTFLAVALALFGIAASGVYVFVAGDRFGVDLRAELARALGGRARVRRRAARHSLAQARGGLGDRGPGRRAGVLRPGWLRVHDRRDLRRVHRDVRGRRDQLPAAGLLGARIARRLATPAVRIAA